MTDIKGPILERDRAEEDTQEELEEDTQEELEEEPEAFIPSFQIAPDDIPLASQVPHIPTQEEQAQIEKSFFDTIGVSKVRDFIASPVEPMTEEKEKLVKDGAQLVSRAMSVILMWGFMLLGWEYGVLAPTEEQADKICRPLLKVWARHSKFASQISPDYLDISEAIKGISEYSASVVIALQAIREDKRQNEQAQHNGRYNTRYTTPQPNQNESPAYSPANRQTYREQSTGSDTSRSTDSTNGLESNGGTYPSGNLNPDERYQFDQLSILAQRDYQARVRRSGRL